MATTDQEGFSAAEKAAMKERAAEVRAPKKRMTKAEKAAQARKDVEEKIAGYSGSDQEIAQRLHRIITSTAPQLEPKTWYGMPAYALDGKILCFIQDAQKFEARYLTLGFNDVARLDAGTMWPTSFAITALDDQLEEQIAALVAQAAAS
ncbi:iron chaperone [Glutamicibacter sp. NPDC087344]|uniref:iron chaperone n=1 Tax=Glutamicibacter sp. NPDC087344 TaxID=3363994 RepID=UPI00382EA355